MKNHIFFKRWFFQGLIVVLPLTLTIVLLYLIVEKTDLAFWSAWDFVFPEKFKKPIAFPGVGLLVVTALLVFIGMLTENFLVKEMIRLFNWTVNKLPFIRNIYSTINKVTQSVLDNKGTFSKVVLIEFPRKGCYSFAFVTGNTNKDIIDGDYLNVYLPTVPVPTAGFYLIVHKSEVIWTKISSDEALKLILSAGIVQNEQV